MNLRQSLPEPLTGIKTGPDAEPGRGLVLVFGATGCISTHLVARLLRDGVPVRAAERTQAALEARRWPGVEIVVADTLRPETLPAALQGVDTVYCLVHSMAAGRISPPPRRRPACAVLSTGPYWRWSPSTASGWTSA